MKIINSIVHMFDSLSGNTTVGKANIAFASILASYFLPITGLLITCFACTIIDMFYGIKVAKKLHKKITSKNNWKGTLVKIKDEFILILLGHLIEYTIFGDNIAFIISGGITVIIALTELWSIIENLNTLNPDGPWRALGKFLKKKGEDYVGIELDLDKDNEGDNKQV